jgi:hypothetical protein
MTRHVPELVLKIINAALLLAIGAAWLLASGRWEAPAPVVPEPDSLQVVRLELPVDTATDLHTMLERPLLWEGRRREEAAAVADAAAPVAPDPFKDLQIVGVYSEERNVAGGIIIKSGGKTRRIRINEDLDNGWALAGVTEDNAIFAGGRAETREIPLRRAPQSAIRNTAPVRAKSNGRSQPAEPPAVAPPR